MNKLNNIASDICRLMDKLNNIASDIRGFCISNPEADFEMVIDFVDSQIVPFEADDDLCDLVLKIMLDVDESNQST
tara:strand:- start:651 stop:878 length:228 start_codon:yes stop_codon:yes gene_type:complete